ncbi:MAG: hypothetical protein OXT65_11230 [Alphaproteobacteria bacterium]|nr:hypothetical protein [Alphaproteobacteria bacterium]
MSHPDNNTCDSAPGAPEWHSLHGIGETGAEKMDSPLEVTLPGQVKANDAGYTCGLVAHAHIVPPANGNDERQGILIGLSDQGGDENEKIFRDFMDQAEDKFGDKVPCKIDMLVDMGDNTCASLLKAGDASVTVNASLRLHFGGEVFSSPAMVMQAAITLTVLPSMYDPGHWYPMFDCHSHWYFTSKRNGKKRFTYCFGPCTTGRCTVWGTNSRFGWGWSLCKC